MSEEEIKKILEYLQSPDAGTQATALGHFITVSRSKGFEAKHKKEIIPFLKSEIERPDSEIRTEVFETTCFMGKQDPELVEELVPALIAELDTKNRFRVAHVMGFLAENASSDREVIVDAVKETFERCTEWFDKPHLVPILKEFFDRATTKTRKFFKLYLDDLKSLVERLPPGMEEIKGMLANRVEEHETRLKEKEEKKKEREKRLVERAEERKRKEREKEELRKKVEEEIKHRREARERAGAGPIQPAPWMKPPAKGRWKPATPAPKPELEDRPTEGSPEPGEHEGDKDDQAYREHPEPEVEEYDEPFSSFSSFGLKRRDIDGDDEPAAGEGDGDEANE